MKAIAHFSGHLKSLQLDTEQISSYFSLLLVLSKEIPPPHLLEHNTKHTLLRT